MGYVSAARMKTIWKCLEGMNCKTKEALFKMIFRIMKRKSEHTLSPDVA